MLVSYCYEVLLNFFYENMAFTPTVKWAVCGELILSPEYNYAGKSTCIQYICYARFSLPTTVVLNRVETKSVNSKFEVYLYSLAFTPSFICLRPIRSSFRSLNRNSWQFAQFPVTRETIQKPIDRFPIYKFFFVRRHVYKPNEQSQQYRRTRIHVSRLLGNYCRLQVVIQDDWPFDNTASEGLMGWLHWQGSFRPFRVYFGRLGFCYCRGN